MGRGPTPQPNPPLFWMHERSGTMKAAVQRFLGEDPITDDDLDLLTWYLKQWIESMPVRPADFIERLESIKTKGELQDYVIVLLRDWAIDPF